MGEQSIREVLGALGCGPQRAPNWMVSCPMPNHGKGRGDRDPSLSVRLNDEGIGLLCGAGCDTRAIVTYLGFSMIDLFFEPKGAPRPDLAELEERHRRGKLSLEGTTRGTKTRSITRSTTRSITRSTTRSITLPNAPCYAPSIPVGGQLGEDARRVLHDMLFVRALYAAEGETRPLPYSTRFCAGRMGWADHRRAGNAIRALEKADIIRCEEVLQPRGKPVGTKCFTIAAGWLARDIDATNGATGNKLDEPPDAAADDISTRLEVRRLIRETLEAA